MTRKEFVLQALIHRNTSISLVEAEASILEHKGYFDAEEEQKTNGIPKIDIKEYAPYISPRLENTLRALNINDISMLHLTPVATIRKCRGAGRNTALEAGALKKRIIEDFLPQ